jgi:hypothetical protein
MHLDFQPVASFEARVNHGDRDLLVYIRRYGFANYAAFAVEVKAEAANLADVFDDHGHVIIGEALPGYWPAVLACQRYAAEWKRKRVEACACEPIGDADAFTS